MIKIRNLGSKENLGVKVTEGICAELCLKFWFENWVVLKATLQKESPKQSLPKVTSGAAVRRCSSKQVFLEISQYSQESTCGGVHF